MRGDEKHYERWCAVHFNSRGELEFSSAFRSPLEAKCCTILPLTGIVRLRIDNGKLANICVEKCISLD